jgi:CheY-like chemotaxis protein
MRVLVIDDEPGILRALARYLRPIEVTMATSASEAFLALASARFDVIVCDLHMPGTDGADFVAKLSPLDAARVVFMTGHIAVPEELAKHYPMLSKPFTKTELLNTISTLLAIAA